MNEADSNERGTGECQQHSYKFVMTFAFCVALSGNVITDVDVRVGFRDVDTANTKVRAYNTNNKKKNLRFSKSQTLFFCVRPTSVT
jgi:hypothetical protein